MKSVLLLGAGMVAKPMADYILDNHLSLTIASRTVAKAEKLIKNRPNGKGIAWTTDEMDRLESLVSAHDLIVSLLPYTYHVPVAKLCIKYKKDMVTTSYVSAEMKELDSAAKAAGILILNEIGVDPGYDHMTAMRIIDKVHGQGGKIEEFYSLCGALAAPEEVDNPFGYKFTWSPRGVVMASNNAAKFKRNEEIVEIPTENLFKNPIQVDFPEVGPLEVYPNRDSLMYIDIYHLPGIKTMFRGTFRYPGWCESLDAMKALGMTSYNKQSFGGKSYREVLAGLIHGSADKLEEDVAAKLQLKEDSTAMKALKWLGLFSEEKVHMVEGSPFDITCDLMMEKMMLPEGARDMVVMLHSFLIETAEGKKEVVRSRLLDFATAEDTSIARTVALPAAIAVRMILEGKITDTGVHIPVTQSIYDPVLDELEHMGIAMIEEWGLPASEKMD